MKGLFSIWKNFRYTLCGLVAFWGFFLIFKNGINGDGKVIVIIALIGAITTFIFDIGNKFLNRKNN
jgi:hypothetical protein